MPDSYLKFVVDGVTGLDVNGWVVDTVAFVSFLAVACISLALNAARWKEKRA